MGYWAHLGYPLLGVPPTPGVGDMGDLNCLIRNRGTWIWGYPQIQGVGFGGWAVGPTPNPRHSPYGLCIVSPCTAREYSPQPLGLGVLSPKTIH